MVNPQLLARVSSVSGLIGKQKLFVAHYSQCYDITEAAKLAGYSCPSVKGRQLMNNPKISRAIAAIQREDKELAKLEKKDLIEELMTALKAIPGVELSIEDLPNLSQEQRKWLQVTWFTRTNKDGSRTVDGQISSLSDSAKLKAIDMLARIIGAYAPEKHDVNLGLMDLLQRQEEDDEVDVIQQRLLEESEK